MYAMKPLTTFPELEYTRPDFEELKEFYIKLNARVEAAQSYEEVKACLDLAGVDYVIDPRIVRGLDYYTRTVFEFVSTSIGAQGTVCAGGRYDGLIEELGGKPTPAVGFAAGIERLLIVMEQTGVEIPEPATPTVYKPFGKVHTDFHPSMYRL